MRAALREAIENLSPGNNLRNLLEKKTAEEFIFIYHNTPGDFKRDTDELRQYGDNLNIIRWDEFHKNHENGRRLLICDLQDDHEIEDMYALSVSNRTFGYSIICNVKTLSLRFAMNSDWLHIPLEQRIKNRMFMLCHEIISKYNC